MEKFKNIGIYNLPLFIKTSFFSSENEEYPGVVIAYWLAEQGGERRKPWFVTFSHFYGVITITMTNFKLPAV